MSRERLKRRQTRHMRARARTMATLVCSFTGSFSGTATAFLTLREMRHLVRRRGWHASVDPIGQYDSARGYWVRTHPRLQTTSEVEYQAVQAVSTIHSFDPAMTLGEWLEYRRRVQHRDVFEHIAEWQRIAPPDMPLRRWLLAKVSRLPRLTA